MSYVDATSISAVIAMTGMSARDGSFFIAAASCCPSISGIQMSVSTTSGFQSFIASSAAIPFSAKRTSFASRLRRWMPSTLRLIAISSTTRIFPGIPLATSARFGGAARTTSSDGILMTKVVPFPTSLSTSTVPPALSTIRFTMGSPRPVPRISPSACFIRLEMSWTNGSNKCAIFSFEMPHPVSRTVSESV